jgi:hypothetical protein
MYFLFPCIFSRLVFLNYSGRIARVNDGLCIVSTFFEWELEGKRPGVWTRYIAWRGGVYMV